MTEQEVTPEILGVLRSMDLFKGKDPDELVEWLGKAPFEGGAECALRQFAPGHRITTEGNFGNTFFILTRGTVSVSLGPEAHRLATLGQGSFFGEMTLISGLPRNASVTALEPCEAIEIPRRAFEYWMKKPGPFRQTMDQTYIERGLANHLRTIPEFAEIDAHLVQELVKKVRLRIFSKDEVIVKENDEADSFYLIRDGFVRVVKSMAGGEQRTVAYLKDGAYFGETALLSANKRNASVIAMGKVEVIQVMKEDFFALVNRDEKFADRLAEERKRQAKQSSAEQAASSPLGFVGEVVERGLIKATSALVIHLNVCTRCGNCVKACAELHDGISRLTRHGMLFEAPKRDTLDGSGTSAGNHLMHALPGPGMHDRMSHRRYHARRKWRSDHPGFLYRVRQLRAALPVRQHLDGRHQQQAGTGQAAHRRPSHRRLSEILEDSRRRADDARDRKQQSEGCGAAHRGEVRSLPGLQLQPRLRA